MEGKDIAFPHHRIYHREFQAGLHTVLSSVPSHCSDLDYFSFSFCFFFFTGTIFQHHIYFLFASHTIYVLLRDIPGLAKVSWWYGLRMPVSGQFVDQQLPHPGGHILWVHWQDHHPSISSGCHGLYIHWNTGESVLLQPLSAPFILSSLSFDLELLLSPPLPLPLHLNRRHILGSIWTPYFYLLTVRHRPWHVNYPLDEMEPNTP